MAKGKKTIDMNKKKIIKNLIVYIFLILLAIICVGPFLWLFSASFKSGQNIYDTNFIAKNPTLANYIGVVSFLNIPIYFINTVIITFMSIAIDVVCSVLCAYALVYMNFKGKKVITVILLLAMIIPAAAGLIINYLIIVKIHLIDTYLGTVLPGAVKVFSIILMRQSFISVPKELLDAARIDGASDMKILGKIMIRSIMPSISTIIIFDFISKWNEFLWPIIVLQDPKRYPLAAALQYLNGSFNYKFGYIAAGAIISVIPVIIVFLMFQKNYLNAISGAIKG